MRRTTLVTTGAILATALACCTLQDAGDDGLSVDVGMVASRHGSASFETDLGYEVTLVHGFAAIASVEIHACERGATALSSPRDLLRILGSAARSPLQPFQIREAFAHTTSSPTLLGVPGVLALVPESDVEADLGELLPPPAQYCTTRVKLGPADADAVMLPTSGEMVGLTLLVEGTWVAPTGGEPQSFRWESTATPASDHDTSFELAEDGAHAVREEIAVDVARVFDGIDFAAIDPAIGADRVAARVADGLRIEIR